MYLALGKEETERLAEYRGLFRRELDDAAVADIRLALTQGRGSEQFSECAVCANQASADR